MEINSKIFSKPILSQNRNSFISQNNKKNVLPISSNANFSFQSSKSKDYESNCQNCNNVKNQTISILNNIHSFINILNDRLNNIFNKLPLQTMQKISIPLEYYHSLLYSKISKEKTNTKIDFIVYQIFSLLKILTQKIENISSKQDSIKSYIDENRKKVLTFPPETQEKIPSISPIYTTDISNFSIESIYKNFNQNKEIVENSIKEMKSLLSTSSLMTTNTNNNHETIVVDSMSLPSNTYAINEVNRLKKENISLKAEINYILLNLKEENKIYEIKEEIYSTANNGNNSLICFNISNSKTEEQYMIIKNYIKSLMQTELFLY